MPHYVSIGVQKLQFLDALLNLFAEGFVEVAPAQRGRILGVLEPEDLKLVYGRGICSWFANVWEALKWVEPLASSTRQGDASSLNKSWARSAPA